MAHRAFTSHPLVVRRVSVQRVEDVTPRMRRVVVGGAALGVQVIDGHEHRAFAAPGFDDHVKLVFATDGDIEAALPRQVATGIEWTVAEHRAARDYTPRRVDLAAGELTLDFVRHGDGPAAAWAESAKPGDELCFVGPKSSVRLPEDIDWMVLIADETGLPAVGRFLDERPAACPVHVLVTVEDEQGIQPLVVADGDSLTWTIAQGADADALERAVRALPIPEEGHGYVWAAAESRALLPVRRYFQREVGIPKDRLNITGYWHAEAAEDETSVPAFPAVPDPLPWFAVRAALELGIIDALADGPMTERMLVQRIGAAPAGITAMLPVLTAHGVVIDDGGMLRLGAAGEELLDEHEREEYLGLDADILLTLASLAPAIRAGDSSWAAHHGRTLATAADEEGTLGDELTEHAGRLAFLLDGLLADPLWAEAHTCVLVGPGSAAVAGAIEDAGLDGLHVLHAGDEPPERQERLADLAVLALALGHRTDEESRVLLAGLAGSARMLVVIEEARPDALGGSAGDELLFYAATGSGLRDSAAIAALGAPAGWLLEREVELGWGTIAAVLRRP
ncbi:SIP domain-containing protein [Microbacterium sp. NPDC055903]